MIRSPLFLRHELEPGQLKLEHNRSPPAIRSVSRHQIAGYKRAPGELKGEMAALIRSEVSAKKACRDEKPFVPLIGHMRASLPSSLFSHSALLPPPLKWPKSSARSVIIRRWSKVSRERERFVYRKQVNLSGSFRYGIVLTARLKCAGNNNRHNILPLTLIVSSSSI